MQSNEHDLVVIGAGPGGYVAAIRAAQLGMNVACVDEHKALGGTCLRVGCIPSKALLESSERFYEAKHGLAEHGVTIGDVELDLNAMMGRKDRIVATLTKGIASLFRRHKIASYQGRARFEKPGQIVVRSESGEQTISAKHFLIATGSRPAALPGVELDGRHVVTSTEALAFDSVPERLVVIGAGYIGLEMGSVWSRLGAEVTVLELLDRILPGTDAEIAKQARRIFEKRGLQFRLGARVKRVAVDGQKCIVECEEGDPLDADRVLVATGRLPCTDGLGLEAIGVETDDKGFIRVDENFATAAEGVYAIGDCIGSPMLAHKASDEGVACVEKLAGRHAHVNYDAIPAVVYTHPEIAAVGKTEEQLQEAGRAYRKGVFPFRANGRARTLGEADGMVKVLADEKTDRLLGVHILGARAGDLIAEAAAAIQFGASSEDLALTSHAHPTLAEAFREAALAVDGRAIHV